MSKKRQDSPATLFFRPIHPFPARMAPSLVWEELANFRTKRMTVLDPMTGSGTTVVAARSLGHHGIGFDTDPLAVLIARAWSTDVRADEVLRAGARVLTSARNAARETKPGAAYPIAASESTKRFVRYWFDEAARKQLAALALAIEEVEGARLRDLLWCAFSRLIIVKQAGASLAMDIAHSRPHRVYENAPLKPLDGFERALRTVIANAPFSGDTQRPRASIRHGDARSLPLETNTIDMVVTSPPYLNAIDYLRGHKFSLIWMGHDVDDLRAVRAGNVGTEVSAGTEDETPLEARAVRRMGGDQLPRRERGMLVRYVRDMHRVLSEIARVVKPRGRAILVLGNSTLRSVFISNSQGLELVAKDIGFSVSNRRTRPLPANRRYLPPPGSPGSGDQLESRMREEVILTLSP